MNDNLYLTGFMGAGKSSVGRALALLLRRRFLDLDDLLVQRLGMPITEAFASLGEDAFRRAESAELGKLASRSRLVVATGGGAPLDPANRQRMRGSGRILHLAASLETCRARLGEGQVASRPLWRDAQAVASLYEARQAAYADCDLRQDSEGLDPQAAAEALAGRLLGQETIQASLGEKSSPVISSFRAPEALAALAGSRKVAIICDHHLAHLHLARYRAALEPAVELVVAPGEGSKTLAGARRLYQGLLDAHMERGDLVVALGGGVVTDLGAFVASTYKRGLDFILVATSLVACVDAAIGGKTALNLGEAKNMVGTFAAPQGVVMDLRALATLPRPQVAEGLVEAYKTGLVADPELAWLVENDLPALKQGDVPGLARVARLSAAAKARVVAQDFRESGLRRVLNLGHTYGHALESHNRFRTSHGQAVAAGLMVAAEISVQRGLLAPELAGRVIATAGQLLRSRPSWPDAASAWRVMALDKKNEGGQVVFVLLNELGRASWVRDLSEAELGRALAALGKA